MVASLTDRSIIEIVLAHKGPCLFDEGGVAQYYFGLNPEKKMIVARYYEIPSKSADTIDRYNIMLK